jgi:GDP-L-fucose synthase
LAARVGGLFANILDNLGFFEDNMKMNMNVISNCKRLDVWDAVFCLSTCVFPANLPIDQPIKEEYLHSGEPHDSNEGYAYAKRMLERQVSYYRFTFGYNWVCIIPTNIYGPHDNFNLRNAHVIPALIHKCYDAIERNKKFEVAGTGNPLRQFIFSEDLATIILELLLRKEMLKHSAYIACDMQCELSIKKIAETIQETMAQEMAGVDRSSQEIVFDTSRPDGIFKKTASNERLMKEMKDMKFLPFDEGIKRTVKWFIENKDTARI